MQVDNLDPPFPPPLPPIRHNYVTKFMTWIGSLDLHDHHEPEGLIPKLQHRIVKFIESHKIQYFLIFLMIVDIGLLFLDLTLEALFGHHPPEWLRIFEQMNYYSTLVVLIIFEFELFMLFIGFGWKFLFHPMYVIDWIFVTFALVLEIIVKDSLVMLIPSFLRMWRILRVAQTVALAQQEYHNRTKEDLQNHIHDLEKHILLLESKIGDAPSDAELETLDPNPDKIINQ